MKTFQEYTAEQMSEKDFQAAVIAKAKPLGWLVYHTFDSRRSVAGFPDLVLVHPGHRAILFRELKTMKGKVSTDQENWIQQVSRAGGDIDVWRPNHLYDGTIDKTLAGQWYS